MAPDRALQDVDLDLFGAEADEGLSKHLDRALDIGLDDHVELLDLRFGDLVEEIVERYLAGRRKSFFAIALAAIAGDLDGLGLALGALKDVAGRRNVLESGELDRI